MMQQDYNSKFSPEDFESQEDDDFEEGSPVSYIIPSRGNISNHFSIIHRNERESMFRNEPLFLSGKLYDTIAVLALINNKNTSDNM